MSKMEIDARGNKYWRNSKGQLHREDGPAIDYVNRSKEWYINGKLHRAEGPAIEYADGATTWYINGRLHRVDGPAVEYADGFKCWFINGRQYSFGEWLDELQISDEETVMLCLKWK